MQKLQKKLKILEEKEYAYSTDTDQIGKDKAIAAT